MFIIKVCYEGVLKFTFKFFNYYLIKYTAHI